MLPVAPFGLVLMLLEPALDEPASFKRRPPLPPGSADVLHEAAAPNATLKPNQAEKRRAENLDIEPSAYVEPESARFALNVNCAAWLGKRHDVAFDRLAVDHELGLTRAARALHVDLVGGATTFTGHGELRHVLTDARLDAQAVPFWTNAEQVLGNGHEVPRPGTGQPRVLGFTLTRRILAGDHLRIHVWLGTVNFTDVFQVSGRDLFVILEGALTATDHRLGDHHPRVIVAEDARVLFVARGIRRDLAQLDVVFAIGRIVEHDAVRRIE